jgi:hypothetical protein
MYKSNSILLACLFSLLPVVSTAGEIHDFVTAGNLAGIESLLAEDPDLVNSKDSKGNTPLHHAVIKGNEEIGLFLIDNGADVDAVNGSGSTPLMIAIDRSRTGIARLLIEKGADIDRRGYLNRTLLHSSAANGNLTLCRLLLEKGAEVEPLDRDGFTPANLACESGHDGVIQLLAAHGADKKKACKFRPPKPAPHTYAHGASALRIPFKLINNNIVIPVKINGSEEFDIALDTGMPQHGILLTTPIPPENLGLDFVHQKKTRGAGAGEARDANVARGATLSLPGVEFTNQRVEVLTDAIPEFLRDDGVMGLTVFGSCIVEIDYDSRMMNLHEPGTFVIDDSWREVDLSFSKTFQPFVEAGINTTGNDEIDVKLVLDTGSGHSLHLFPGSAAGFELPSLTSERSVGFGLNGEVTGQLGRISSLRIGPFFLDDVLTLFHDPEQHLAILLKQKSCGILGNNALRRFNVVFDYSEGKMYLKPNGTFGRPFEYNMTGLSLRYTDSGDMRVFDVLENSPAAQAGVERGDIITSINGKSILSFTDEELYNLFRNDGERLTLIFKRGGCQFSEVITLKRII